MKWAPSLLPPPRPSFLRKISVSRIRNLEPSSSPPSTLPTFSHFRRISQEIAFLRVQTQSHFCIRSQAFYLPSRPCCSSWRPHSGPWRRRPSWALIQRPSPPRPLPTSRADPRPSSPTPPPTWPPRPTSRPCLSRVAPSA